LVPWVADVGHDGGLQRAAPKLARDWLGAKQPLPPGARSVLLSASRLAQGSSGRELLDAMLDSLSRTGGGDRQTILAALGSFREPALAEAAYDALFAEKSDARDGMSAMLQGSRSDEMAAAQAVHYLHGHYDALIKRLPEHSGGPLARVGNRLCDANAKAEFDATFSDRAPKVPGGARNLAQADEEIGICLAARQLQRATLKAYVAKQ